MFNRSWFDALKSRFTRTPTRQERRASGQTSRRLRLEVLEDRRVLAFLAPVDYAVAPYAGSRGVDVKAGDAVTKGQQDRTFENAAFVAKTNKVLGPVKTQFGYYVFEVTKITAASQQSLQQAKNTISQLLTSLLTVLAMVGMMLYISPLLALIALVTIPVTMALSRTTAPPGANRARNPMMYDAA